MFIYTFWAKFLPEFLFIYAKKFEFSNKSQSLIVDVYAFTFIHIQMIIPIFFINSMENKC